MIFLGSMPNVFASTRPTESISTGLATHLFFVTIFDIRLRTAFSSTVVCNRLNYLRAIVISAVPKQNGSADCTSHIIDNCYACYNASVLICGVLVQLTVSFSTVTNSPAATVGPGKVRRQPSPKTRHRPL